MSALADLRPLVETASARRVLTAGVERVSRRGYTMVREAVPSTATNSVHVTTLENVPLEVEAVRTWFRERGCEGFTWWIGSCAEPHDLAFQLTACGARDYEPEPLLRGMVLGEEPASAGGVEIRPVASATDLALAVEVQCRAFAVPDEERRSALANVETRWRELSATPSRRYLAFLDGEPVATAGMERLETGNAFLLSGCVVEAARGRGVYRALVHRRWSDARAAGWLPLVVQAGSMSAPILERCGFRTVGTIRLLEDRAG